MIAVSHEERVEPSVRLVTCDVFDTALLRDGTSQRYRFDEAAARSAGLLGCSARTVSELRRLVHQSAYRALATDHPQGEARFDTMAGILATLLQPCVDTDRSAVVEVLRSAELATEAAHLRPHRRLLAWLDDRRESGLRVVAVSDTWHRGRDLAHLITAVTGTEPFDTVYTSADLGATKHAGSIFDRVLAREGVAATAVLHVGDSLHADVDMAQRSGWRVRHVPRTRVHTVEKLTHAVRHPRRFLQWLGDVD